MAQHSPDTLVVTIIAVEEVLGGWYWLIRQAKNDERLVRGYHWLQQSIEFFRNVQILPFNHTAVSRYHELRRRHRRVGTNDLRIAPIALENQATLVSRNHAGFNAIADLKLEDCSS